MLCCKTSTIAIEAMGSSNSTNHLKAPTEGFCEDAVVMVMVAC